MQFYKNGGLPLGVFLYQLLKCQAFQVGNIKCSNIEEPKHAG